MNASDLTVLGISGLALVTLIVGVAGSLGLPDNRKPAAAVVAGLFVSGLYQVTQLFPAFTPLVQWIVGGLLLGAGGPGIYSIIKAGQGGKSAAPAPAAEIKPAE